MIEPARLAFSADGTPYSEAFGDVYHSADGGLGQAQHVFLGGNGLPERWRGRESFVIVETGFGLGLNFLATWAAWRADPARPKRLHFVSVEKHPFTAADLATLHARWPEFADLSAALVRRWPMLVPGFHRLHFDADGVTLTLLLGDAADQLPQLVARADAFYLDGFSPAKNPDLWSDSVCTALARLAAPGATLATWSVAGTVRDRLAAAGFVLDKAPGFGGKREMLRGTMPGEPLPEKGGPRSAIVIGAGIAGSSAAERLAARGWEVTLIDRQEGPGKAASSNRAGVFRPLPSLDDNRVARLLRAGFLYGSRHLQAMTEEGLPVNWKACGVLHIARDEQHESTQRRTVEVQAQPPELLRFVERDEAARLAGWPVVLGGWWFPRGGWVQPPTACLANVDRHGQRIRKLFGRAAAGLEQTADGWRVVDAAGETLAEAPIVILANAADIRRFAQAERLPIRPARGQVSHLPATATPPFDIVACRLGYVTPVVGGFRCFGATTTLDDPDPSLRLADTFENIERLEMILPGFAGGVDPASLDGRVGFRPMSPDRLPIIGALPRFEDCTPRQTADSAPRWPGLHVINGFGARGLVWAALSAELLASRLCDEPLPVEAELANAVDPVRYALKPPKFDRNPGGER